MSFMRLCVAGLVDLDPTTLYALPRLRSDVFVVEPHGVPHVPIHRPAKAG